MSIASEITRLQGAKASIKSAIEAKGVTVPSNALLDSFATYIAQISGGSTGLVYETGTYTPAEDIARPEISFSRTHTSPPVFYSICDVTDTIQPNNSCVAVNYVDSYKLYGSGYVYGTNSLRYGTAQYIYRPTGTTSLSQGTSHFSYDSDTALPSSGGSVSYARYWATESKITPSSNSSTRYWRANRTYKWIAVWK